MNTKTEKKTGAAYVAQGNKENTITRTVCGWSALDSAVVVQLGYDSPVVDGERVTLEAEAADELFDVSRCSCGAAGGFTGFIWFGDTWQFFRANRDGIRQALQEIAESCGDGCAVECVLGFNCYRDQRKDARRTSDEVITADDVGRVLWGELPERWEEHRNAAGAWVSGSECDPFAVANSCAFFALEETANRWSDGETVEA